MITKVISGYVISIYALMISVQCISKLSSHMITKVISGYFISVYALIIWASTRENLSSGVCEQHRHRPACASAQTDQRLCYSLLGKYHIWACYRSNLKFLASLCS